MDYDGIIEKLITEVSEYLSSNDLILVRKALELAEEGHQGYTRLDGSPYFYHALGVATILSDWKAPVNFIIAGLLHDLLKPKYSKFDSDKLLGQFSSEAINLIVETNEIDSNFDKSNSTDRNLDTQYSPDKKALWVKAMMHKSPGSLVVKIADRLHNAKSISALPDDRREIFANNAINIFAAISNSLGMSRVVRELQDLSFCGLNPTAYEEANTIFENARSDYRFEELTRNLHRAFEHEGLDVRVIPYFAHRYGIHRRILAKGNRNIQAADIVSFRIITEDCYSGLKIIHHYPEFQPLNEFKDHIAIPKANGYRALHTRVVKHNLGVFDISIQTEEMYKVAEMGVMAEWFGAAKSYLPVVKPLEPAPDDWIMIFTPAGEVKNLPRNATVVDFAYAIHPSVGHRCISAQINGEKASVEARLQHGDVVEVYLGNGIAGPDTKWLDFVVSEKARLAITDYDKRYSSVNFNLNCIDRVGILSDLSQVISTKGHNFRYFSSISNDMGEAEIEFRLDGVETEEIDKIAEELQRIPNIYNVLYQDSTTSKPKRPTNHLSIRDCPFSTQKPSMDTFKGRKNETFQVLRKVAEARKGNTLLIWGQKRIGKSFLLEYLMKEVNMLEEIKIIPMIIDLQSISGEPTQVFLHKIMKTISSALAIPELNCPNLQRLNKNPLHYFMTFFANFNKYRGEQNLLIMLDEFQGIETLKDGTLSKSNVFQALRNLIQHEPHISFIISGGGTLKSLQKNMGFSSLMTVVDHIHLKPLKLDEGKSLIADTVEDMNITNDAIQYLLDITGCHPCYIQLLCKHLYEDYVCSGREITLSSVAQIIDKEMKGYGNFASSVSHFWQLGLGENHGDVAEKNKQILMVVADPVLKEDDWMEFSAIKNKLKNLIEESELYLLLEELTDYGSLTREQSRYKITIPLFGKWLRNVKPFGEIIYL